MKKRKTHDKRFAYAAKELTLRIRKEKHDALIQWECYMTARKDGDGAGSAAVSAPGYKTKRYIIFANERGHWYTL